LHSWQEPEYGRHVKGVLPSTAVFLAVAAQPAAAAFPGTNGRIAVEFREPGERSIATVNADGTNSRRGVIDSGPGDVDPAWSPDGRRLAFTSFRDGNEEVYVWDAETGGQTRVTFNPARDHDPTWSPDGTRLAFAREENGNEDLYVKGAVAGGPETRLTADPAADRQPTWSTTGAIAFESDRTGDFEIWAMNEDGGGLRRLTQSPGEDVDPSWSPLGDQLVFAHADGSNHDLHAVGADGQNRRELLPGFSDDHFPVWSPDGTRIAFVRGENQLTVIPAEGLIPGTSFASVGRGTDPDWGPIPAPIGAPDQGRNVSAAPLSGRVLIAPATTEPPRSDPAAQAQLRSPSELPTGTTVDASQGTLAIEAITTTPDGPGTVGRAEVAGGIFTIDQIGNTEPTLRLRPGIRPCQRARTARVPPEARIRIRSRGRFRTIGGYGRASARGTDWAMRERCDGTVFQVREGVVLVHDYRRRRSFRVRAGRCYLAAVRQRPDALRPSRRCPRVGKRSR
jgi:dipeptidyl aminopeptidase/acylaminoacyl peptidase